MGSEMCIRDRSRRACLKLEHFEHDYIFLVLLDDDDKLHTHLETFLSLNNDNVIKQDSD